MNESLPIFLTSRSMADQLNLPVRDLLNSARRFQIGPDALYETKGGHLAYLWRDSTAKKLAELLKQKHQ